MERLATNIIEDFDTKTGWKINIRPVPYILVEQLRQEIKDPPVPKILNRSKGTEMENPQDPNYIQAVKDAELKRDERVRDAALAYGIDILEPNVHPNAKWIASEYNVPRMDEWMPIIEDLEFLMKVDILSDVNLENPREVKILFLKYIVLANPSDLSISIKKSIGLWDAAQVALDSFRNQKVRQQRKTSTDRGLQTS